MHLYMSDLCLIEGAGSLMWCKGSTHTWCSCAFWCQVVSFAVKLLLIARWDKGSYYVTYIGTDPNEGPTIVSRYLEKPYKPYDPTLTWGERLESVRAKVGSLEETETAGIYESAGDFYSFDARVVYRFEDDRLVSITYMPKTKQTGGFFTSAYDLTEEEGHVIDDRLRETYGGYDSKSIEQGRLSGSAIWHFATTTISMSAEGHIFSGRFTLLVRFRQAEL